MQFHASVTGVTSILVVDDSASYRFLLVNLLKKWNFSVFEAENGEEALDILADNSINMVISDWEMPVMDGFTLTRNIKQDARFKGIPVIIHSSLTGSANEGHVKSVGADAYIAKFVAEELGNTIRSVLVRK